MSWQATGYVKSLRTNLSRNEKFVLMTLADYHRVSERAAYPSDKTLAKDCLMTERGLQQIVSRLKKKLFIVKTSGCGRGNVSGYQIVGLDVDDKHDEPINGQSLNSHVEKANGCAAKGEQPQPKGRTAVHHNKEGVNASKNEERESIVSASADDNSARAPDFHSQHSIIKKHIETLYLEANNENCPWDRRTGKVLKDTLRRLGWSTGTLIQAVNNRFASEVVASEDPMHWLSRLPIYLNGSLDKFNKPINGKESHKNGRQINFVSTDQRRWESNRDAVLAAHPEWATRHNSDDDAQGVDARGSHHVGESVEGA